MPDNAATGLVVAEQSPLTQGDRIFQILRRRTHGLKPSLNAGSRCVEVSLCHLATGPSGEQQPAHIFQRIIPDKTEGDELDVELRAIADEVALEAVSFAGTATSTQTFAVVFYGKNQQAPLQQHRFTCGPSNRQLVAGDTEPPTLAGISAQQMRHTEIQTRMMVETWQQGQELLAGENHRLREENRQLRTELSEGRRRELETFDLIQTLKDRQAERDRALEEQREMAERGKQLFEFVTTKIIPEVVAKYSPAAPAKSLLGKIRPEQMFEIVSILDSDQLKEFGALLPDDKRGELEAFLAQQVAAKNGSKPS